MKYAQYMATYNSDMIFPLYNHTSGLLHHSEPDPIENFANAVLINRQGVSHRGATKTLYRNLRHRRNRQGR